MMLKQINAVRMLEINPSMVSGASGWSPIKTVRMAVMIVMLVSIPAPRMVAMRLAAIP